MFLKTDVIRYRDAPHNKEAIYLRTITKWLTSKEHFKNSSRFTWDAVYNVVKLKIIFQWLFGLELQICRWYWLKVIYCVWDDPGECAKTCLWFMKRPFFLFIDCLINLNKPRTSITRVVNDRIRHRLPSYSYKFPVSEGGHLPIIPPPSVTLRPFLFLSSSCPRPLSQTYRNTYRCLCQWDGSK
jgi:hypothetical protein